MVYTLLRHLVRSVLDKLISALLKLQQVCWPFKSTCNKQSCIRAAEGVISVRTINYELPVAASRLFSSTIMKQYRLWMVATGTVGLQQNQYSTINQIFIIAHLSIICLRCEYLTHTPTAVQTAAFSKPRIQCHPPAHAPVRSRGTAAAARSPCCCHCARTGRICTPPSAGCAARDNLRGVCRFRGN